jgi:hypothetical protein
MEPQWNHPQLLVVAEALQINLPQMVQVFLQKRFPPKMAIQRYFHQVLVLEPQTFHPKEQVVTIQSLQRRVRELELQTNHPQLQVLQTHWL